MYRASRIETLCITGRTRVGCASGNNYNERQLKKMETAKSATAPVLEDRMRIASDLLRFVGASVLAGIVTACVVAAVVILLSGSGA
jgi:hypothetical protein